jgi:hypothetical protein
MSIVSIDNPLPIFLVLLIHSKIIENEVIVLGFGLIILEAIHYYKEQCRTTLFPRFRDPICLRTIECNLYF